jgi:hypothetical protein
MPDFPVVNASQKASLPSPLEAITPRPVITTLRFLFSIVGLDMDISYAIFP